jgi:hypothetical protein
MKLFKNKDEYKNFLLTIATPEVVSNLTVIHYGNFKYSTRKFRKIENKNWVKPKGGLWTSPINSEYGWKHFCDSEHFRECNEENSFKLKFKYGTKIVIIDSVGDLNNMPKQYCVEKNFFKDNIDFELLVKYGIDAIWLTTKGQWATRLSQPMNLYGWDCDTVFIMNKNCCYEPITRKVIIEKLK